MRIPRIAYLIVGFVLLAGMFYVFKPKEQSAPNQNVEQESISQANPTSAPTEATVKTINLEIKSKKIVSGPETITISQGDEVLIKITADEEEEFHIHGYDKFVNLEKDKPAELSFTADITGRFPFELEHSKTDIGVLEVLPK